jgi:hypothetical protein
MLCYDIHASMYIDPFLLLLLLLLLPLLLLLLLLLLLPPHTLTACMTFSDRLYRFSLPLGSTARPTSPVLVLYVLRAARVCVCAGRHTRRAALLKRCMLLGCSVLCCAVLCAVLCCAVLCCGMQSNIL